MKKATIIVSHTILPPNKSGSKLIYEFSRYLNQNNYFSEVNVIQPYTREVDNKHGAKFLNILPDSYLKFFSIRSICTVIKHLNKQAIDVVIIEYPWLLFYMICIKIFTKSHLIMHEHNIEFDRFRSIGKIRWKILYFYEYLAYKVVDDVLFITKQDQNLARKCFGFKKGQYCPYGIDINIYNNNQDKAYSEIIKSRYNISKEKKILLFFGSHTYYPNLQAIDIIESSISPLLEKHHSYVILICGGGLSNKYTSHNNIIYTGFVDDIVTHIKGCDIMINPILSGGGVKTKVIESLACGKTVISTRKGAEGIEEELTDGKLIVVEDNDWNQFVNKILICIEENNHVSQKFKKEYNRFDIVNNLNF